MKYENNKKKNYIEPNVNLITVNSISPEVNVIEQKGKKKKKKKKKIKKKKKKNFFFNVDFGRAAASGPIGTCRYQPCGGQCVKTYWIMWEA